MALEFLDTPYLHPHSCMFFYPCPTTSGAVVGNGSHQAGERLNGTCIPEDRQRAFSHHRRF